MNIPEFKEFNTNFEGLKDEAIENCGNVTPLERPAHGIEGTAETPAHPQVSFKGVTVTVCPCNNITTCPGGAKI